MIDLGMLTRLLEDELELEVRSGTTSRPLLRLGIQAFLLETASLRSRISNLESEREKLRPAGQSLGAAVWGARLGWVSP